jgi:hypothetical protein
METNLYLMDLSITDCYVQEFYVFFTDFIANNAVALLTEDSYTDIPLAWTKAAKYVFASGGNELYINNKLRYKYAVTLTKEVEAWIQSKNIQPQHALHKVFFETDSYVSALLVQEFNELFNEFTAQINKHGFAITDKTNARKHIEALISSNYNIIFVSDINSIGTNNFELANSILNRGCVYGCDSSAQLMQLLTSLQEK